MSGLNSDPEIKMNANPFELPDRSSETGDDAGASRSLTRVEGGRLLKVGEKPQDEETRASPRTEISGQGECAESSSHEPILSEKGNLGIRLLRVAVLAVCYFLLEIVVKAVTVLQFIYVAWRKQPHAGLRRLGANIAKYMASLWLYCTFASDDAPWPFRSWPRGDAEPQS